MLAADGFANATEHGTLALQAMTEKGIPATPQNYTIWYNYVSGNDPLLVEAIDALIEQGKPFNIETSLELHQRFFQDNMKESEQIRKAGVKLYETLKAVLLQLATSGSETATHGDKISSLATDLQGESDIGAIQSLIHQIITETSELTTKNKALQSKLEKSSEEIDQLQKNLEKVRSESLTDPLTQIGNRKLFDAKLMEEAGKSVAETTELSLLLLDVDHFKKFNDTYGHRVGDEVLKVVAKKLKECVKGQDIPARYGGEEFACILPGTTLENAAIVADQIREKIAKQILKNRKTGEAFGRITISAGVALYKGGENLETLIQRADEALYRAKTTGRNRVITEIH